MEVAGNVHLKFLQKEAPLSDEWELAYYFKPMWGVSGDFYDFYEIENNLHGLGIFDVSGHGIASGLVGIIAKAVIYRSFRDGLEKAPLKNVLDDTNKNLINEIGDTNIYLTGIILRFEGYNVEYVNAAHKQLLHKKQNNKEVKIVTDNGTPINGYFLGIDLFEHPYNQATFTVEKGDELLLYTDCLSESHANNDPHFEEFGDERIIELFKNAPEGSPQDTLNYILKSFYEYVKTDELTDDLTIIIAKKK